MLQRAESVTLAFLVLLEKLSPEERAVFLLKEIFEYDHSEIGDMLAMTVENSRQLLHRAKTKLADGRPKLTGSAQSRRAVAERFARAFSTGDGLQLTELLAQDVGLWSDGGGKATAARRPLLGREHVLNFLVGLHRTAQNMDVRDMSLALEDVNSEPALVLRVGGHLQSLFVFSIDDNDVISAIRVVRNPDKLARIDRQLTTLH